MSLTATYESGFFLFGFIFGILVGYAIRSGYVEKEKEKRLETEEDLRSTLRQLTDTRNLLKGAEADRDISYTKIDKIWKILSPTIKKTEE